MAHLICEVNKTDPEKVMKVKQELEKLPIVKVTSFLKAIADSNRCQIVNALCIEEALCVCDIAALLDISVANASSHLRKLYKEGVVSYRKEGKLVYYSLNDEHVRIIMMMSLAHMEERND